ncbi:hypothetical protein LCGC14_2603160 [marine sediment metagenome]|uniref:Uncharacterized protein n=1 Tax=marine sediment metagenome TaxID=412755 RepID=A0A0F9A870_9ZZZZ
MLKSNDQLQETKLYADLEALEVLVCDCGKLLANWRVATPYKSDKSPDAVISIIELQDDLREQIRVILNKLSEEQLPF